MKKVIIVAIEGTAATTVTGPMDLLSGSGVLWNVIRNEPLQRYFNVQVATQDGNPVTCVNGFRIEGTAATSSIRKADIILVSSIFNIIETLEKHQRLIAWLKKMYDKGVVVASICTGAFILAATGILDNKKATTHWGVANQFKSMFPNVDLDIDQILVDSGSVLTSGGANAGFDLSLYLIERYFGKELAMKNAKVYLQDSGRRFQTPYIEADEEYDHPDERIKCIQEWILDHLDVTMDLTALSKKSGYSLRTFERRFKKATGEAPLTYIQKLKVQKAKSLLENTMLSFDEITYQLGYQNSGSFRKIFVKNTRLLPSEYRSKFQRF